MEPTVLRKEGKHQEHEDMEFWPEDGLIYIEDRRMGDFNVVSCDDFVMRADALKREAKRCKYRIDEDNLNEWVLKMYEVWKEAKEQGDPMDIEVAKKKHKERRRAIMVTGMW